ncbi:glycine cleavage system protein H [Limosilactobacillus kribbianus]|uniref:glycine cleavage system protein H n=1 Tax=Limosilactobacillus kribbianus TaxID=2982695 RepID=UPI0022640154|nr:glycine cleavage system protein H [Limosilactobacillus kribbianus]
MAAKNNYFWTKKLDNGNTRVGLNDQGRDDLGKISFIDVPAKGASLKSGDKFISVEAEKAVTDLDSPVDGTIVAVNDKIVDDPAGLSSTDENENWIVEVK